MTEHVIWIVMQSSRVLTCVVCWRPTEAEAQTVVGQLQRAASDIGDRTVSYWHTQVLDTATITNRGRPIVNHPIVSQDDIVIIHDVRRDIEERIEESVGEGGEDFNQSMLQEWRRWCNVLDKVISVDKCCDRNCQRENGHDGMHLSRTWDSFNAAEVVDEWPDGGASP